MSVTIQTHTREITPHSVVAFQANVQDAFVSKSAPVHELLDAKPEELEGMTSEELEDALEEAYDEWFHSTVRGGWEILQ